MFVVTLSKTSLKKLGAGAACCALVVFSAMLGRFISTRTVAVAAPVNRIESAQDIQTWFTGYGLEVDGASITADKVKIPRRWDDSFSAFNSGDWGERHDEQLTDSTAQQTSGEPEAEPEAAPQAAPYTELPLDAEGYPVE